MSVEEVIEANQEIKNSIFLERLREKSKNKEDPVPEWEECGRFDSGTYTTDVDAERCLCTTAIRYIYWIKNKHTGEEVKIGSTCINRWWDIHCENCQAALGNKNARRKQKRERNIYAFWCPDCKKEDIKLWNEKRDRLGEMRLFWYGKYRERKFSEFIDDVPYVEKLINVPEEKKNDSVKLFEKYANMVYEINNVVL